MRLLMGALFVFVQLSGIYRLNWAAFWALLIGGALFMSLNRVGLARRWRILPSLNLVLDPALTIAVLSLSSGADGPYVFLIYLHVLSAVVFLRDVRIILGVGVVQVASLFLSALFILLGGSNPNWSHVAVHSLGLMIIASSLTEPAKGLYQDAETDPLTGVLNRRSGMRELEHWVAAAPTLNLLFADLKKFKRVNDTYGHAAGDKVLRTVAARILKTVRADDFVIRYGGDEFIVVTKGDAEPLIERLRQALSQTISTLQGDIQIEIDFGFARYPEDGATADELLNYADQHMFSEKRAPV